MLIGCYGSNNNFLTERMYKTFFLSLFISKERHLECREQEMTMLRFKVNTLNLKVGKVIAELVFKYFKFENWESYSRENWSYRMVLGAFEKKFIVNVLR